MGANFAIIGAGRVGSALAEALFHRGWKCAGVISRRAEPAERLATRIGASIWGDEINFLPENFSHLFLCTPDDKLSEVQNQLAGLSRNWKGVFIAQTSGAHSSLILQALAERGAIIASLHPAMSFTGSEGEWQKIINGWFALEGNAAGQKLGSEVLAALDAKCISLLPEQKTIYHIACVLVANYLVTLHSQAEKLFASNGVAEGRAILQNLSHSVLENLETRSTPAALTGPIARGDVGVIEAHLRLLTEQFPQMLPLYCELGKATLELAREGEKMPEVLSEKIDELLRV
jgi:predicted short-subunit dehydrogenase-like oxidoreductase (DUF2520 family)